MDPLTLGLLMGGSRVIGGSLGAIGDWRSAREMQRVQRAIAEREEQNLAAQRAEKQALLAAEGAGGAGVQDAQTQTMMVAPLAQAWSGGQRMGLGAQLGAPTGGVMPANLAHLGRQLGSAQRNLMTQKRRLQAANALRQLDYEARLQRSLDQQRLGQAMRAGENWRMLGQLVNMGGEIGSLTGDYLSRNTDAEEQQQNSQ